MKAAQQQHNDTTNSIAENTGEGTVSYVPPDPFGRERVMQQKISIERHQDSTSPADREKSRTFAKDLDASVQKSYNHLKNAPTLSQIGDIDGHIIGWKEKWGFYRNGQPVPMLSAAFGYAVESLATMIYKPGEPEGMNILLQQTRGGTRPDVVLAEKGKDFAWLDITASDSEGHIDAKSPEWEKQNHVFEISYPSFKTKDKMEMSSKGDTVLGPGDFDEEKINRETRRAKKLYKMRVRHWRKLGQKFNEGYKEMKISRVAPDLEKMSGALRQLNEMFNLGYLVGSLIVDSDIGAMAPDTKSLLDQAPHIISALGKKGTKAYGFRGGAQTTGELWLLNHDPELPQFEDLDAELEKDATAYDTTDEEKKREGKRKESRQRSYKRKRKKSARHRTSKRKRSIMSASSSSLIAPVAEEEELMGDEMISEESDAGYEE